VRGLLTIVACRTLTTTFSGRGWVCHNCFHNAVVASLTIIAGACDVDV
jgi:hypothetical protein